MTPALGPLSIVALIFGGCCSNVFALEAILRNEPDSGLLITFLGFIFTALAAYPSQSDPEGDYGLRKPTVPLEKWAYIAAMHFGINVLNNWAFAYNISVPVHIILRSFGSVSSMIAGAIRGKRYSKLQVLSVVLVTVGVLVTAWADAENKGKDLSTESASSSSDFTKGLIILLAAQFLSAFMGAYVEDVFASHGANWTENMFYTHALSLPLFLPMYGILDSQYTKLKATPPFQLGSLSKDGSLLFGSLGLQLLENLRPVVETLPQGVLLLLINAMTQIACIAGVNLLSSKSSAVTVTVVLNIRKLVSFVFSTILFGHELSNKTILGSVLVFGSGALYGYETSWRLPQRRKAEAETNRALDKNK